MNSEKLFLLVSTSSENTPILLDFLHGYPTDLPMTLRLKKAVMRIDNSACFVEIPKKIAIQFDYYLDYIDGRGVLCFCKPQIFARKRKIRSE